jgi:hypothetical protein
MDRLDTVIEGDYCRMCKRDVHDLTDMDAGERKAFLAACGGDACISYVEFLKPTLAAAAVAATAAVILTPGSAMAQKHKAKHAQVRRVTPELVPVMLGGAPVPMPMDYVKQPQPAEKPPEPAKPPRREEPATVALRKD